MGSRLYFGHDRCGRGRLAGEAPATNPPVVKDRLMQTSAIASNVFGRWHSVERQGALQRLSAVSPENPTSRNGRGTGDGDELSSLCCTCTCTSILRPSQRRPRRLEPSRRVGTLSLAGSKPWKAPFVPPPVPYAVLWSLWDGRFHALRATANASPIWWCSCAPPPAQAISRM